MSRFTGYPYNGGLFVLDTWSGEVVKVPEDGSAPTVLRAAVVEPMAPAPMAPAPMPSAPAAADGVARPALAVVQSTPKRASQPRPSSPSSGLASASMSALDREVIGSFPYPIARTYQRFLGEEDPRQRCKLLVDTFTHIIKLWALQTASEYLHHESVEDTSVSHTLSRDFQRPLISAWNLMLSRGLPVLQDSGTPLFAPELQRAYEQLESRCRDKVSIETPYKDAEGHTRVRVSKLGRIQALIRYRNSLAHGYNQSRTKAQADLQRFRPVLTSVLEQARFSSRYPLFYAPSPPSSDGAVAAYRLMGAEPSPTLERLSTNGEARTFSPLFLYNPASHQRLPLHLFLDVEDFSDEVETIPGLGWDVLMYEGHTRTSVIYVSVSGHHVEKQGQLEKWRALLGKKAVRQRALTLDSMKWSSLLEAAERESSATLQTLEQSGRYIPEVTIERPRVARLLEDFERSDYRAFVLTGDNGMGKSTLLASHAQSRQQAGDLVLFYRAAGLRDTRIESRILRDLGIRNAFFEDFLAALERLVPEGRRVRVIVDSLHEHPSATHELTRAIDALVEQAASYPFFRVLTSVRTAAYERLPPDARLGLTAPEQYFTVEESRGATTQRTLMIELRGMSPEQVARAYERYRAYRRPSGDDGDIGLHVFRPLTPFSELAADGATIALMRVPLFLRLLMAAHAFKPLPPNLSFDQAMEPYMDDVVVERDEPGGGYPERRRFLYTLVALLDQENADSVARDRLYHVPKLAAHLTNSQKDSAYVQLLELGILIEDWEGDQCAVRFAFDGLFEHLLATLHYPRIESPRDLLALVERALSFRSLRAALVGIMRRAIRTGRQTLVLDACDMCALDAHEHHRDPASLMLVDMVRDVIVDLARFRDPGFEVLCTGIPDTASHFDIQAVSAAFDILFTMGEVAAAARLAMLAANIAEQLGENHLRARALLRWAKVDELRGQPDQAFPRLLQARALAESASDPLLCHRIDLIRAQLLMNTNNREQAAELFQSAHSGLVAAGQLGAASTALRGLASIAARGGQTERAESLNLAAIELAERAGEPAIKAKALNNLAMVQVRRGAVDSALQSLERSLAIKEKIGARASIATTELNLGALHYERGELAQAGVRWRGALATFDSLEHARGSGLSLCNLALLAHLESDADGARTALDRSVSLFIGCSYQSGQALATWLQASLALDCGSLDGALGWIRRMNELAVELGSDKSRLQCQALELRVAIKLGDARVDILLGQLRAASDEQDALGWDIEEGPAGAFLDAVRHLREQGREPDADALLAHVRARATGRPFARASELAGPGSA